MSEAYEIAEGCGRSAHTEEGCGRALPTVKAAGFIGYALEREEGRRGAWKARGKVGE